MPCPYSRLDQLHYLEMHSSFGFGITLILLRTSKVAWQLIITVGPPNDTLPLVLPIAIFYSSPGTFREVEAQASLPALTGPALTG